MLLCLDRDHRLAYVLGEVFALGGEEGAEVAGIEPAAFRKRLARAREQIRALVQLLEAQLGDGRPHLLGAEFSLADAASFHPLWFLRAAPGAGAVLEEFPRVRAWLARVDEMGHGERTAMEPAEALAIARDAVPAAGGATDPHEPNGLAPGTRVAVLPDDYGFDPVAGELVASSVHEVAVRRRDPAIGEVVVHFPRIGFRVARA